MKNRVKAARSASEIDRVRKWPVCRGEVVLKCAALTAGWTQEPGNHSNCASLNVCFTERVLLVSNLKNASVHGAGVVAVANVIFTTETTVLGMTSCARHVRMTSLTCLCQFLNHDVDRNVSCCIAPSPSLLLLWTSTRETGLKIISLYNSPHAAIRLQITAKMTRELQDNDTQKRVNVSTHGIVKKSTCVSFSKKNEIELDEKTPTQSLWGCYPRHERPMPQYSNLCPGKGRRWLEVEQGSKGVYKIGGAPLEAVRRDRAMQQNRPDLKKKISHITLNAGHAESYEGRHAKGSSASNQKIRNTWTKVQCLHNWQFSFTLLNSLKPCLWRFSRGSLYKQVVFPPLHLHHLRLNRFEVVTRKSS